MELKVRSTTMPLSQAKYDAIVKRDLEVPMRDGAILCADVYLPTKKGGEVDERFPTILVRTRIDDPEFIFRRFQPFRSLNLAVQVPGRLWSLDQQEIILP